MGRDGGAPICPQGRQARVKGIMDGTATRTSLQDSSGTPPHVGCSPLARVAPRASGHWRQGGHTLLHCLGESSLPPQHKKSSSYFLFRVFFARRLLQGQLLERCSAAPTPATNGATRSFGSNWFPSERNRLDLSCVWADKPPGAKLGLALIKGFPTSTD